MSEWQSANMGAFIPDGLADVLGVASGAVNTVVGILNTIQTAVEAIRTFLIPFPGISLADTLIFAVETFRDSILATGMSMLNMWDYPIRQYYATGITGDSFQNSFERDMLNAFTAQNDPNFPGFVGDTASFTLLVGAPGFANIYPLVNAIKDAFVWWQELKEVQEQMDRLTAEIGVRETLAAMSRGDIKFSDNPSKQTQDILRLKQTLDRQRNLEYATFVNSIKPLTPSATSSPSEIEQYIAAVLAQIAAIPDYPGWQGTSLQQVIKPLPDLLNQVFDPLIASLQSGKSIIDTLDSYIETVSSKIDLLSNLADTIATYLAQLDGLISATGLYALFAVSGNGITGLAQEIAAAENKPFEGLSNGFYSGFTVVGGGPSFSQFVTLFRPIGT